MSTQNLNTQALEVTTNIDAREAELREMFAPYPELRDIVLCIYEQSKLSPNHEEAFENGVKMAEARSKDKDIMGMNLSIDDVVFSQLFTGSGGCGRLEVLINNCKGKLERLTNGGWNIKMTHEHIATAFRQATQDEETPNWNYHLSGILQFMRTAYTTRRIQIAAEKMFEAKQAKARTALGLAPNANLPSDAYTQFPDIDRYTQQEVRAVSAGKLDPESLAIEGQTDNKAPLQITGGIRAALGELADDPIFDR